MKRFLILFFLMLSFAIGNAQPIKTKFYGCELGKTTKAEFLQKLKERGLSPKYEDGIYFLEDVSFAGRVWPTCQFSFYNNKLMMVGYGTNGGSIEIYDRYVTSTKSKYPDAEYTHETNTNHRVSKFTDDQTTMSINYVKEVGETYCMIYYIDIELAIQKNAEDDL